MTRTNAWLLNIGSQYIGLAQYELIEVISVSESTIKVIPIGPDYCQKILIWRSQLLPLVDFSEQGNEIKCYIVVAWQIKQGEPLQYGAFALSALPENIEVDDEWQAELPTNLIKIIKKSALSCFKYNHDLVVIPDLKVIYGEGGEK